MLIYSYLHIAKEKPRGTFKMLVKAGTPDNTSYLRSQKCPKYKKGWFVECSVLQFATRIVRPDRTHGSALRTQGTSQTGHCCHDLAIQAMAWSARHDVAIHAMGWPASHGVATRAMERQPGFMTLQPCILTWSPYVVIWLSFAMTW